MQHISAKDFAQKVSQKGLGEERIIDVREPHEWEVYHLDHSQLIPLSRLPDEIDHLDPSQKYYVLCAHGVRSLKAAEYLTKQGYSDVVNVEGGIAEVSRYLIKE